MPQPRPPGNLKEQCLRSIIKNIDSYWCRDYIKNWLEGSKNLMYVLGPFEDLRKYFLMDPFRYSVIFERRVRLYYGLLCQ